MGCKRTGWRGEPRRRRHGARGTEGRDGTDRSASRGAGRQTPPEAGLGGRQQSAGPAAPPGLHARGLGAPSQNSSRCDPWRRLCAPASWASSLWLWRSCGQWPLVPPSSARPPDGPGPAERESPASLDTPSGLRGARETLPGTSGLTAEVGRRSILQGRPRWPRLGPLGGDGGLQEPLCVRRNFCPGWRASRWRTRHGGRAAASCRASPLDRPPGQLGPLARGAGTPVLGPVRSKGTSRHLQTQPHSAAEAPASTTAPHL